jgi:hypothetical protein
MRYEKGTIELSATRDHPLLRQVLRCGFVTGDQLFEFLRLACYERDRESCAWRLRRLVKHGLIVKQGGAGHGRMAYSIGTPAALLLQGLGEYCLIGQRRLDSGNPDGSILHALELNEVQLSLLRAGLGARWTPACDIRSQNVLNRTRYAKDYDAVIAVPVDGEEQRFALEYERTAKARQRYATIARLLDRETLVVHVLYLVPNHDLLSYLTGSLRPTAPNLLFGIVRDWHEQLLDMPVVGPCSPVTRPLKEALKSACSSLRTD